MPQPLENSYTSLHTAALVRQNGSVFRRQNPCQPAQKTCVRIRGLASWWIPSNNEWYKAAYYDPTINGGTGGYWSYGTRSNTAPGNQVGSGMNQANYHASGFWCTTQSSTYDSTKLYLTPVGTFTNSTTYYGTYDQAGDLWNWVEDGPNNSNRGLRGGSYYDSYSSLASSTYNTAAISGTLGLVGFRIATSAPEPGSGALVGLGAIVVAALRRRRAANRA